MKRLLAIIISVSVVLSCCIIGGLTASAAIDFWDGTTKTPVDTDSDGFCEIYTAEELAWVAQTDTSSKFILMNDIYINDLKVDGESYTKLDGSPVDTAALKTWVSNKVFSGTLDGNGYTVSGLYNVNAATNNQNDTRGLVGKSDGATFKNLRIVNTYMKDGFFMGNLFGYTQSSKTTTIDTVYVEDTYVATSATGNYPAVGGLFGYVQNATISVSNVAVVDTYLNNTAQAGRVGAFWGDSWNCATATVTNSYSALTSHNPWGSGRAVGNSSFKAECSTSNVYAAKVADAGAAKLEATLVSQDLLKGKNALISAYGLGESFYTTAGYPMQEIFLDSIDANVNKQLGTAPFDGAGTEADPYLIKTADDLRNAIGTYGMGKYYKLANDIVLNDVDKIDWATGVVADGYDANVWFVSDLYTGQEYNGFAGRGAFSGTLDGDGYAVHGLYIPFSSLSTSSGLVPVTSNATIKNIAIKNSFMAGGHWTGGITGYSYANTTFDTVLVDETVTVVGYDVGNKYFIDGWVKKDNPNAAATPFMGTVSGGVGYESECAGGIVGYVNGTGVVNNCAVYGTVRGIADNEKFTTTNPLTNGGETVVVGPGSHICAMVGTGWNSNVTISDCVSVIQLHDAIGGTTTVFSCTDSYAQAKYEYNNVSMTCCNVLEDSQMSGANALTNMPGLSPDVWTKTAGYPLQKIFTCLGANHADEHVWTDWAEATPPECAVPGEETRECSVCGEPDSKPVDATGHDPATEWTSDANGHWHVCGNNCGEKLDYAAHTFDQRVETSDYSAGSADCTKPAQFYFSCVCGEAGDQTFDSGSSMGHSPKTDWVTDENNHWHECNNCDEKLDLDAHVYDQTVVNDTYKNTAADCDNAATYFYSCVCGKAGTQFFSEGNPAAHVPATDWTSDADGHWHECANCDDKLDYAAHSGGEATCTDKAVCDDCGTAYGDVDPDNHDLKDVPAGEASHDNDGNIAHKKCNDCDKLFDDAGNELAPEDVIVDGGDHDYGDEYKSDEDGHWKECECGGKDTKADHTFGEWEVKSEPSAVTPGEKTRECSVCGFEETAFIPATEDTPGTGDHASALPWMAVAAFSMMALASVLVIRKRKA